MKKYLIYYLLAFYAVISILTIIFFDGTRDAGDSVHHFLFAKYAPQHPDLFFDHWAKPLFVLLAAPFAQFGFTGMKVFNVLVSILNIFFTYKVAQKLGLKNAVMAAVIMAFIPLNYVMAFSGLTEPLFALFTIIGFYLFLRDKFIFAAILISFLPFIRTEGLIIIAVAGFYLLVTRKWKAIPFLLAGHVVYSAAGYFVYHDILWVFTKIPYASMDSVYGSGNPMHFINQLYYALGIPITILFWLGFIRIIWNSIRRKISKEEFVLIFLGFFAFFIAHSLFWYLGIFNSMGLKRVLVAVMPLAAIIALNGFNMATEDFLGRKKQPKQILQALLVIYIMIFPVLPNPAAINFERDMKLSTDQRTAREVARFIKEQTGKDHRFVYTHPYLSMALDIDHFDPEKRIELTTDYRDYTKAGDIIIWENWFAVVERGVHKSQLEQDPRLTKVFEVKKEDSGAQKEYAVFAVEMQ